MGHPAPTEPAVPTSAVTPESAGAESEGAKDSGIVVEPRGGSGLGFVVTIQDTGRHYRIAPARDPRQPRFWCIAVTRCGLSGQPDLNELPWVGPGGLSRDDLPEVLNAIRADLGAWMAQEQCADLREWMLAPAPDPPVIGGAATSTAAGARRQR